MYSRLVFMVGISTDKKDNPFFILLKRSGSERLFGGLRVPQRHRMMMGDLA